MLRFYAVLEPGTRTLPRAGRKALKSETWWTQRELWLWTQPSCLADPQTPKGWEGAVGKWCIRLLYLLSTPAVTPSGHPFPGFGHPNTLLARTASPGEYGGIAGCGEAVLPNRRCQAVVRGEPSASAQPGSADTAQHRWPGGSAQLPN